MLFIVIYTFLFHHSRGAFCENTACPNHRLLLINVPGWGAPIQQLGAAKRPAPESLPAQAAALNRYFLSASASCQTARHSPLSTDSTLPGSHS